MSYGRGAALLSALVGVTGLMTYAFQSIVAHTLGRDAYGMIAVLWAAVFLTASVIYRPVEQLLSRTIAEQDAHGQPTGDALRVAATIQLGLAVLFAAVALALRGRSRTSCSRAARPSTGAWSPPCCCTRRATSPAASSPGHRRFGLYGGLVLMESASRLVHRRAAGGRRLQRRERRRGGNRGRAAAQPGRAAVGARAARSPAVAATGGQADVGGAASSRWRTAWDSPARCS